MEFGAILFLKQSERSFTNKKRPVIGRLVIRCFFLTPNVDVKKKGRGRGVNRHPLIRARCCGTHHHTLH